MSHRSEITSTTQVMNTIIYIHPYMNSCSVAVLVGRVICKVLSSPQLQLARSCLSLGSVTLVETTHTHFGAPAYLFSIICLLDIFKRLLCVDRVLVGDGSAATIAGCGAHGLDVASQHRHIMAIAMATTWVRLARRTDPTQSYRLADVRRGLYFHPCVDPRGLLQQRSH